jgi:metal-dependent HD superfamily phosphatase/phosphodiesterase
VSVLDESGALNKEVADEILEKIYPELKQRYSVSTKLLDKNLI